MKNLLEIEIQTKSERVVAFLLETHDILENDDVLKTYCSEFTSLKKQLDARLDLQSKLSQIVEPFEKAEEKHQSIKETLSQHKNKLLSFSQKLGDSAFSAVLSGELEKTPHFDELYVCHTEIQQLEADRINVTSETAEGIMNVTKQKTKSLKISAKIKLKQNNLKKLSRTLGEQLLTFKLESQFESSLPSELIASIQSHRSDITNIESQLDEADQSLTRFKTVTSNSLEKTIESCGDLQAALRSLFTEISELQNAQQLKARRVADLAIKLELGKQNADLDFELQGLKGIIETSLTQERIQAVNDRQRVSKYRKNVAKLLIGVAIISLLSIVTVNWFGKDKEQLSKSSGETPLATQKQSNEAATEEPLNEETVAEMQLANLKVQINKYKSDVGSYPSVFDGLNALLEKPASVASKRWKGPYLNNSQLPLDPWEKRYEYKVEANKSTAGFTVSSAGRDGISGNADDITVAEVTEVVQLSTDENIAATNNPPSQLDVRKPIERPQPDPKPADNQNASQTAGKPNTSPSGIDGEKQSTQNLEYVKLLAEDPGKFDELSEARILRFIERSFLLSNQHFLFEFFSDYLRIEKFERTFSGAYADESEVDRSPFSEPPILSLSIDKDDFELLSYTPNGEQLIVKDESGTISFFDAKTGNFLKSLTGPTTRFQLSPDGKLIASFQEDINIWNINSGERIHRFEGHLEAVNCVAFSSSDNIIASGSDDETIRIWDLDTGDQIRVIQLPLPETDADNITSLSFSPNGKQLVNGTYWDGPSIIWDVETGNKMAQLQGPVGFRNSVQYSPDGKIIGSTNASEGASLWDANNGERIAVLAADREQDALERLTAENSYRGYDTIKFSRDGALVFCYTTSTLEGEGMATIWDANLHTELVTLPFTERIAITPNGRQIAKKTGSNKIDVWNTDFYVLNEMRLSKYFHDDGSLDDLRAFREIETTAAQILADYEGDSLELSGLIRLEPESAELLAKYQSTLFLDGLANIDAETAKGLSKHEGILSLGGLKELEAKAASQLGQHRGVLVLSARNSPYASVSLGAPEPSGLNSLSDIATASLSAHEGALSLDDLQQLSDSNVDGLSKHVGPLSLNGVTSLSDNQIDRLSSHAGNLYLNGLTELTPTAAASLGNHKGVITLAGITSISAEAALNISSHDGDIFLGVTSISVAAAENLASHKHSLFLPGIEYLAAEEAEALALHEGQLFLDGIKSLSESAAAGLGLRNGYLSLAGLDELTDEAMKHLSNHRGFLDLRDLHQLSLESAAALSTHRGGLDLSEVSRLEDIETAKYLAQTQGALHLDDLNRITFAVAHELSKHVGPLTLNDLREPSAKTLEALSQHTTYLQLNRVLILTQQGAKAMADNHKGVLCMDGIQSLSDEVAEVLARHQGHLYLRGLKDISLEASKQLAKHPNLHVHLPNLPPATQAVFDQNRNKLNE